MSSMNVRKRTHWMSGLSLIGRLTVLAILVVACAGTTGCGGGGGPVVVQQPAPGTVPLPPTDPTTITAIPTTTPTPTAVPTTTPTPTATPVPTATPLPTLIPINPSLFPTPTPTATTIPGFPGDGTGGVVIIKKRITKEITIIRPIGTGQWGTPPAAGGAVPGADGAQTIPPEYTTCYTQQEALMAAMVRYNTAKNVKRTLIDAAYLNELVAGGFLSAIPGDATSLSTTGPNERVTCSIHGCPEAPIIK